RPRGAAARTGLPGGCPLRRPRGGAGGGASGGGGGPRRGGRVSGAPEDLRDWRLPRGRHGLPRELVTRSQRERLLVAVVRVVAANGYEQTTVGDILEEAGVGRESFYELFESRRDCMLAAHALLVDDLEARVREAYLGEGPFPLRLRAAVAAALDWFAEDPAA